MLLYSVITGEMQMLLKNYILITDTSSKEALQKKLGLSAFSSSFLNMEIIFYCPPAEKITGRSLDEKCTIATTVSVGFSGPAL